ncbi:MAG: hypothetical protein IJ087_22810 [Eggerthellaceae bacterium]|nr:hypothetical protein [Eggerthellaceae bacterium]
MMPQHEIHDVAGIGGIGQAAGPLVSLLQVEVHQLFDQGPIGAYALVE